MFATEPSNKLSSAGVELIAVVVAAAKTGIYPVSYTHLTLPTNREV